MPNANRQDSESPTDFCAVFQIRRANGDNFEINGFVKKQGNLSQNSPGNSTVSRPLLPLSDQTLKA